MKRWHTSRALINCLWRACFIVLLGLQACGSPQPYKSPQGLSYLTAAQLRLRVGRLEIANQYTPAKRDPFVDHLFPMPPTLMVKQWIKERFVPAGGSGHALVTIEDASVVEKRLSPTSGFGSLFSPEPAERYEARVVVKIEIMDERGYPQSYVRTTAQASKTVTNQATLRQRQDAWTALMEELMNRLNEEMEKNIKEYLSVFVML